MPVDARITGDQDDPLDVVLLAVKSQHTEEALAGVIHRFGPHSCVVSLQNGLCEQIIAGIIGPQRTIGCFVNFSADYLEPGIITYGGSGSLYLGELDGAPSTRVQTLAHALSSWGPVSVTANIWGYLWGKLGYAAMLFATALADETMADVIDRYRPLMVELAAEVYAVAAREGVVVEPFDNVEPGLFYPREGRREEEITRSLDALVERRRHDQKSKSGIWRDLAVRRRTTEVDQQIGLVVEYGARHGLQLPLTRQLVTMIHDLEAGRRPMCWENLEALDDLRRATYGDAAW